MNEALDWFNKNQGIGVIIALITMVTALFGWLQRQISIVPHPIKQKVENGELSNITPKIMVNTFKNNSPVQADEIVKKHYIGLRIKARGIIERISSAHTYFVFSFQDKHGVQIVANLDKPVSNEVSILKKGDKINVMGEIFNIGEKLVVLDHCILKS